MVKTVTARRGMVASALLFSLALAGYAMPTTYHPASDISVNSPGYSGEELSANTYEVDFTGNYVISRDTVDRYLFYRAAQLTIQKSFGTFTMMKGDTAQMIPPMPR